MYFLSAKRIILF